MSLAPYARLSCPTFPPCVTHDAWRFSKLSSTSRAVGERSQVLDPGRLAAAQLGVLRLVAPRDEGGEPAGLVLELAQPEHVLQALRQRLHRAVHHRRRRAQSRAVGMTHHVEPFVSGRLAVAVQQPAHAIDEDLGAAAGNAVEADRDQPVDHAGHRQPRQTRQVDHLGRRQGVQPKCRVARLHRSEQVLVPLDRQVGIVPALQQQLAAAERDGLVDLAEDFVEPEHVPFRRSDRTVERAEVAARDADVRVVDVAIDDVGDDAIGMTARTDFVGQRAEKRRRRLRVQLERLGPIEPSATPHLVRQVARSS